MVTLVESARCGYDRLDYVLCFSRSFTMRFNIVKKLMEGIFIYLQIEMEKNKVLKRLALSDKTLDSVLRIPTYSITCRANLLNIFVTLGFNKLPSGTIYFTSIVSCFMAVDCADSTPICTINP